MLVEKTMNPTEMLPVAQITQGAVEWDDDGPIYDQERIQGADGIFRPVDRRTCMRIQCGFLPQEDAGFDLLYACSYQGYSGVRNGCTDSACQSVAVAGECEKSQVEQVEQYVAPEGPELLPFPVPTITVPLGVPMPSITGGAPLYPQPMGVESVARCPFSEWVAGNKFLAGALVVGSALLLGGRS